MRHRLLALAACATAALASAGAAEADSPAPGRWAVEGAVGLGQGPRGEYEDRLRDFGFRWVGPVPFRYGVGVVGAISPAVQLVADFGSLDAATFTRDIQGDRVTETQYFSWTAHAAGGHLRLLARFQEGRLNFYLQGGVGAAFGRTRYTLGLDSEGRSTADTRRYTERAWGRQWVWTNGVQWTSRHGNGVYLEFRAITAVIFVNPLYDRHQSGGARLLLGARWAP